MRHPRSSKLRPSFQIALLCTLSALALGEAFAQERARKPTRVLVVEEPGETAPRGPSKKFGALQGALAGQKGFEVRNRRWKDVRSGDVDWAECYVLGAAPDSDAPPAIVGELATRVRSGRNAVVHGNSARRWPTDPDYSALLGREMPPGNSGIGKVVSSSDVPIAIAVLDQRHVLTQCVTHFIHEGSPFEFKLRRGTTVLAESLPIPKGRPGSEPGAFDPVIWLQRHGAGRVAVCRLALDRGASRGLAAVLLQRCVQWAAAGSFEQRPVTIPLTGEVKWAASALGPADAGLIPGLPPRKGFFRGRQIAQFMTYHGASWLIRRDRESTEEPDRVLESLKIAKGSSVCDLGCGNGYFTLRMARHVGPEGTVYGVDIQKEMLELLKRRAETEGIENVVRVLGTPTDPKLPPQSVDLVLMVDVYHELSQPAEVLRNIRKALTDRGRIALVEYRGEDPSVPIKHLHRLTEGQARAELEAQGFRWLETKSFLKNQHIFVFEKTSQK